MSQKGKNTMKKTYKIDVDCANCANKMEEAAKNTAGVKDTTVNFNFVSLFHSIFSFLAHEYFFTLSYEHLFICLFYYNRFSSSVNSLMLEK